MEIATYMNHTLHKGEQLPNRCFLVYWAFTCMSRIFKYLSGIKLQPLEVEEYKCTPWPFIKVKHCNTRELH